MKGKLGKTSQNIMKSIVVNNFIFKLSEWCASVNGNKAERCIDIFTTASGSSQIIGQQTHIKNNQSSFIALFLITNRNLLSQVIKRFSSKSSKK